MAKGFNLTAELNIRGPNNLRTVVSNIKKQVGSISANITPTVNRSNIRTIATDIRSQLGNINVAVGVTANRSSIQNLSRDIRNRLSGIDVPVSVRINRASITAARRDITRQLGSINANVNIAISATATRNAAGLNRTLTGLNQTLNQTTTSATNAAAAIQAFAAAMRGAGSVNIPRNINISLNTANTNATNAAASVQQLGGEVENFGRQAGLAIRRFAAFTTVTSVFYGLARAVQSGITSFIDFDRELVRISQVTGDNIRDVNKLASTVTQLATTYGVSSKELAGVSLTLAQAGLTAKETERALKALALSALAPSFDDLNSTVEGSIALMRQFGISTNQLEGALGSINSVAAKFAVEASDIIAAIQRTGGVFAAASKGVSEGTDALNEFVAVFTSIRATTRESAETIATGLRTIFTRIQRGPTIEALKQFGVNLTDVEGKFVGAYKAVQLLSEGLTRLDPRDLRFSQIVEELGGFRQIGKVIPLIQEFATAQEALKVAQAGSGSLAGDAAKGQLALAVQISKVREEFAALIRSVGDTSSFRTLVKLGLDLASSLIQVADAAKELLPLIGIFTAIRGAQALTRFGAGFAQGVRGTQTQTRGFASGGYVPGVGNSDTVPARLTPGEFVIRKKAVQKIGVSNLAKINRNGGGYIPEQYFNDGGPVQRFTIGGGAKKKGINWKSLVKGRGKKGSRGPRGRFDLPQPGDADFAKWQREIYAEYDADPSLTRVKVNGIPMPPEIAYANQLITEEVFGDNVRKKSGKLKKTPLGLLISASKMPRGPRAPAGEMEKIMAGYQQSPEFQKQTSGAGSSLFSTLKGPLSSFKKGGTFGGVITPGSDNATQIKAALGKLLSQSSGQDAVKAKTALDKFDSFIAGGTPEKPGHVSHFTWAMNQIFKKGIATFGRGGRASNRLGVFDFDMTTATTRQKETPSLSGFRDPKLAVPDILGASPTGLVGLMKKYGASKLLTARSGGPRGEMRTALGTFFKRNGVMLPSSSITTLGDQVGNLSTAEKKARALYQMVKKYGSVDFFDDDAANIDAARMVRGVSARKVSVMKNLGGVVQKFMAGKKVRELPDLDPNITQLITKEAYLGIGKEDQALQSALLNLIAKRNKSVGTTELASRLVGLIRSNQLTPQLANEMLGTGGLRVPTGPGGKTTIQALSLEALGPKDQTKYTRNIAERQVNILRASPTPDLSSRMTRDLMQGARIGLAKFIRTGLTEYAMQSSENKQSLISRGIKFDSRGRAVPPKAAVDAALSHGDVGSFLGPLFERGIIGLGAKAGPNLPGKAAPIDTSKVGDIVASIMTGGAPISSELPTELRASKAKTRASKGVPDAGKRGLVNQILRFFRLPGLKFAQGGSVPGIRSSRATEAILGKQLSGVEMIRAARRAGYDIEELDNGMVQLSRNNKIMHTLSRPETSKLLGSISTGYNKGGPAGSDTVPALLTPGEFVINKKAAARLGSSRLHRLNRADKISGFNTGGEVGRVPTYSSGGDVQRFFFGGGARARPGAEANAQNLMVPGNAINQLREMLNALNEIGVASSRSADLLRRGGRVSVQAANDAYQADILRLRVAGAPMDTILQAEARLANMRQQGAQQVRAQRQLSGVGGAQLQVVEDVAQQNIQRMFARAQAAGVDLNEAQRARIEDMGYRRAAQAGGLSTAQTAGLSGNDLRQYINAAMGDPRTFEQMNRQFEARRRAELNNQYIAENRFGGDRRRILQQASRDAAEEARIRRQTLTQTRGAAGPGASTGQRVQQGMFGASFAIPMLAQMLAGDPSRAATAGGAAQSAAIQGAGNTVAMGTMIASMFPPGIGQGLALAATAAASVAQAFIDARNATIEFEKNLAAKKVEMALEDAGRLFEKLSKDIKDIDVQNAIGQKLIEASSASQRAIEIQATTAKAFWVNMFDAFGGGNRTQRAESSQRSQILDRFGTSAYLETTTLGQSFRGGRGTAQDRANEARLSYVSQMIPEQSREISKQFAPIADNAIKLIEEKVRGGLKIEDYINTDEFKKLGNAIALANTAVSEQVLRIRNSTILTDAQKTAQEKLIIATFAEEEARRRASIAAREIQLKEVQKVTTQLSRSLERMFQNMEQSINKTNFGLEKMSRELDLVSASLTGQAKAGEGALNAINILQNPRAYGEADVTSARGQAAGFFGGSGDIIKGLLTLGDDIEATIMGTINKTVRESEGDSPAKIAIAIEKSVKDKLQTLQLPSDVSEKLAREVKVALNEIRKEGDEKADFTQIEEKLKDLGRILESTRRAQEVALKALENWQTSLNNYTSSINTLADLQIDFQARLRKSSELIIDSQLNLARTLGKDISLENLIGNRNALTRQQTGGLTSPQDIFRNINRLEAQRRQQEGAVDVARQRGPTGLKDFMAMSNSLKLTNVALRENYDALRNLAENSDIAAAALNKIQEAQQRQQGKVGFIEKLVTSTPEEFESLNRAFIRLQNNANGQVNTINNSVGAQKAYIEAINGGATAFEAMRAAQTAFANERRDTLSALNDLLPFLGSGQQANQIRANTLESMLTESGIGVSPMFADVLNALRNPETDPETQRAIALYQEANQLQIAANNLLNQINQNLQAETAEKSAKAIADALANTVLTFKNAEQADLNRGVIPQNRATGGIIYASNGAFAPRGTDTVPAMLTPGEFVVNKSATAKNLPLLKSINSQKYSSGGKVRYYAGGGLVSSYLNRNSWNIDGFQESSDKFLDPSNPDVAALLDSGKMTKKLQILPNVWYRMPSSNNLQTPRSESVLDPKKRIPTELNITDLYPSSGDILPGMVSHSINISDIIEANRLSASPGRLTLPTTPPGLNKNIIFGIDGDKSIDLITKNIKKSEFEQYKKDMNKVKNNFESISWIQDAANPLSLLLMSNLADQGYPTTVTPLAKDARSLNPNSRERNRVLYYGNQLVPEDKDYGKLWEWTSGSVRTNALTIGDPTHKPNFDNTAEDAIKQKTKISAISPKGINKSSPGIVKPKEIKDIVRYHKKQFDVIKKSVILADNNFKNIKFVDTPEVRKYQELQTQFSNLYNNLSPYEIFEDLSLFDHPFLKNAKSLIVASNVASTRGDIKKYIENKQANLEPGSTQPNNNGNPILVGLLDALDGNLNNLTQEWVKKREFDIFPQGPGGAKQFPYLVNANIGDLGKGFEERAKQAVLDQQNRISQELVFDNRKMRLTLGAGKNIDLPYSATYTKYSGPLWDNTTKSFSEDRNKQLKNLYLPEDANIFKGLDIDSQRLFSGKQPFDLNAAGYSIPDNSANKLIELITNNGDQNQIDQAKNDIIKNSTLTFPHRGPNVSGSLIKLQNAVGQQIFSGYSQLPSTTFSFGEFLAQAINDYAVNNKKEAGIAAGKVADQKLGKEIIGDAPMETVRVLQQLTQGALGVFGSRPVPGLPRGWLFNNIRSLAGILPRGGRTSVGNLANNEQAKSAAGIIRNVINNAGSYVSNLSGKVNNPQLYSGLKDTYGLMWGAYKAFDSINKSDTRNLAQLLNNNTDIESIFRTLGASASFEKAAAAPLSEDYKAMLGNQLVGSKITTVDAAGNITLVNPADAPPPKVDNYSDLMNLALNPYNEFSSRTVRSSIFDKLIGDISTAVDNRGMPYFDPNTSNFLIGSLDSLKKWYGGDGAWLGQDYLFDKAANADPVARGQQFTANLDAGRGLYEMANMAHRNLGGSVKYGDLPGDIWLKNRVEAGNFATGGLVYASNGTLVNFQPRGTDTVPAMLTPGEFVVNRSATQKNLPLLKSINSNTYMADGGLLEGPKTVQGVAIPGKDNLSPRINKIDKNISINTNSITSIQKNIKSINDTLDKTISGGTTGIDQLKNDTMMIANTVMSLPTAINDQMLVALRQLWNDVGAAIGATLQGLMNAPWPAAPFNKGGPVYASNGQLIDFQPRGTDTVPAMLTPGEFVVNRAATQKNLPLLKSINSGVGGYSRGGVVYAQEGTLIPFGIRNVEPLVRAEQLRLFDMLDSDSDGMLSLSEVSPPKVQNSQELFKITDTNRDNFISRDEFLSMPKPQKLSGLSSAEIGASGPRTPEGDRLRALQQQREYQDVPLWFGKSRKETENERQLRIANSTHPDMTPGLDAGFYPNLNMAMQILGDIGSGYVAGGSSRSSGSTPARRRPSARPEPLSPRRDPARPGFGGATRRPGYGNENDNQLPKRNTPQSQPLRNAYRPISVEDLPSIRANADKNRSEIMHLGAQTRLTRQEILNLIDFKTLGRGSPLTELTKLMAFAIYPPGNADGVTDWESARTHIKANIADETFYNRLASRIKKTSHTMKGKGPSWLNQEIKAGGRGVDGKVVAEEFANKRFTVFNSSSIDNFRENFTARLASLQKVMDTDITKILTDLGIGPKTNKQDILYDTSGTPAGSDYGKLTDAEKTWLKQWDSRIGEKSSGPGKYRYRGQTRSEPREGALEGTTSDSQAKPSPIEKAILQKMSSPTDTKAFHGTGSKIMSIDPKKLIQGMLGEAFYVGFDAMEAPINYLRMGLDKWLRSNNLKKANVTPEQIAQFQGGIYPVSIRGGIDDFVQADQVLRENPSALAKVQNIYRDLELKRTRLGPIEYVNDPTTGRPKASRTEQPFDLESATMMEAYDNIQNQLAARYEASFAGKANIPDPRGEALSLSARDMRTMFVKYGIPGITDLKGAMGQGAMAGIFDESRIALGDAFIPDQVLKEVLGYDDIRDAKQQIEAIRTGKDPAADMLSRFGEMMTNAQTKNRGGIVYASKGQLINFQPKGTDIVPAMLTPGEFVINRQATQKNLPLLKAINSGTNGYSDGGVVYLQNGAQVRGGGGPQVRGGGGPQVRPGMNQMQPNGPRQPRIKDELDAYKRGGLKDRLRSGSKNRFDTQALASQGNQAGRLWVFTVPREGLLVDGDGNPLNNGFQYILKDGNGKPSNNLSTESLAAMDISKIFSVRANSAANARKAIQEIDNGKNNRVDSSLAIDAISAISKAKQQQARKSFDQKILDELSYQIETKKDIFSIFNPNFFNTDAGVVDKYNKDMSDIIDTMDLNNPASVMAGLAALGPKAKRVKNRKDYLEEIIRNNQQAIAILRAANLDFTDPANMRQSFQGNLPTFIHQKQIDDGGIELRSANAILQNLMNNPKIQMALQNPMVARSVQAALMQQQGFGVPISTFEGGPGAVNIPQRLARGGVVYANDGALVGFQSRGTDTIPAMLTPGEFVVNRRSAQSNLPLLQAINSGLYNRGGKVSYLAGGTAGTEELYKSLANFSQIINTSAESLRKALSLIVDKLNTSNEQITNRPNNNNGVSNTSNPTALVDALGNRLDRFIEQLQNALPPVIKVEGQHQVNVVINGASILQQLLSGPIGNIVQGAIQSAFDKQSRKREGN